MSGHRCATRYETANRSSHAAAPRSTWCLRARSGSCQPSSRVAHRPCQTASTPPEEEVLRAPRRSAAARQHRLAAAAGSKPASRPSAAFARLAGKGEQQVSSRILGWVQVLKVRVAQGGGRARQIERTRAPRRARVAAATPLCWRIGHSSIGLPAALCALLFLASASRRCLTRALGDRLVFAATDEQ